MSLWKSVVIRSTACVWNRRRSKRWKELRKQLKNEDFTIFSSNCIGGMVYHDLGLPFLTPTVNYFMNLEDFLCFCENPKRYLAAEFSPYSGTLQTQYPLAELDGLVLHLVHYATFESARDAWNRRKQRVNLDNIFLVATDRDGFNAERSARFDRLPFPKVLFVHQKDDNPNHFYIKGFEKQAQVGNMVKREGNLSGKRIMDQFDWIKFLNRQ